MSCGFMTTSNGTTWRAMQQTGNPYGLTMEFVIGDRLYFDEHHGPAVQVLRPSNWGL